jgi:two-component system sensor histidine kinase DevS
VGLFHITQEALANIAKHARARNVLMNLRRESSSVILSIQDNGRGFDATTVKAYTGHGLRNMQERARALDAQLRIDSTPGQGTLIEVKLPVTG